MRDAAVTLTARRGTHPLARCAQRLHKIRSHPHVRRRDHPLDRDQRYDAFVTRDRSLRDAFLVGVTTTGVYCAPGCPARAPRRENVRFFETAEAARAAGLRACKRCRPDDLAPPAAVVAAQACRTIEAAETAPVLEELARQAGLSPFHFHRLFKAEIGITPAAYAAQVKDRRAKAALTEGSAVTAAVYDAGYGSSSRFYEGAGQRFGMAPKAWRDGGGGEEIRVAIAPCSLGFVLVGATDRGVCAVELGDDAERLDGDFARRFSGAKRVEADRSSALVERWWRDRAARPCASRPAARCARHRVPGARLAGAARHPRRRNPHLRRDRPRHRRAQGRPRGGRGLRRQSAAVLTPCHRVVGADGKLGGYHWGAERKRVLLEREQG